MRHTRRLVGGVLVLACATLAAQQAQQARSSASGVYTAEQAAAGEKIYFEQVRHMPRRRSRRPRAGARADRRAVLRRVERQGPAPAARPASRRCRRPRRRACRRRSTPPCSPSCCATPDMPSGPTALPTDRAQLAQDHVRTTPRASRGAHRRRAPAATPAAAAPGGRSAGRRAPAAATAGRRTTWTTYGGNLASQRYSPADQITKDNFNQLEIAWRLKTDFLGPAARHAVFGDAAAGRTARSTRPPARGGRPSP